MCSGSERIRDGDTLTERLAQSLIAGPNIVTGTVRRRKGWDSRWRDDNLIAGARIEISGERKWSGKTSSKGEFEAVGLPAGEYRVRVESAGLVAALSDEWRNDVPLSPFKIEDKGCVQLPVMMWADRGIRGTVRTADGQPAAGVRVEAYSVDRGNVSRYPSAHTVTDAAGTYVIRELDDGTYAIGVNGDPAEDKGPYRLAFHPRARSRETAAHVVLGDAGAESIDIVVDPPRNQVEALVRVVRSDGSPANRALVNVSRGDKESLWWTMDAKQRLSGADGVVKLQLWEGDEYTLSATWFDPATVKSRVPHSAEGSVTVSISAGAIAEIRLGPVRPLDIPGR